MRNKNTKTNEAVMKATINGVEWANCAYCGDTTTLTDEDNDPRCKICKEEQAEEERTKCRHDFTKAFRDILAESTKAGFIDATSALVWGLNGLSREEIMEDIIETVDAHRHDSKKKADRARVIDMIDRYTRDRKLGEEWAAAAKRAGKA